MAAVTRKSPNLKFPKLSNSIIKNTNEFSLRTYKTDAEIQGVLVKNMRETVLFQIKTVNIILSALFGFVYAITLLNL